MSQTPVEFLRNLSERLRHIPVDHGVDDGDVDELRAIANAMDSDDPTDPIKEWVETMDRFLIDVVRLSIGSHPDVFKTRDSLVWELRNALEHVRWDSRKAERERIKKQLIEVLR